MRERESERTSSLQVKEHALSMIPDLLVQTCGSYRRGKATCGDVDILITHADGISHRGLLIPLVDGLKKTGHSSPIDVLAIVESLL